MKNFIFIILMAFVSACGSDEPKFLPSESDVNTSLAEGETTEDAQDEDSLGETLPSEFLTQEEFDNRVVGHLWAEKNSRLTQMYMGQTCNSDGEAIFVHITGLSYDLKAFKIADGKVYDYYKASWPGLNVNPPYQAAVIYEYTYTPSTGELKYKVYVESTGKKMERCLVLKSIQNGKLEMRYEYGRFPKGCPTLDVLNDSFDWNQVSEELDPGSHIKAMLDQFTPEEEAEYVSNFVLMN